MSTEILREAAALMRERAEGATPGPWTARATTTAHSITGHGRNVVVTPQTKVSDSNTQHIASWHPAVALAVADWLDAAYADWHYSEHSLGAASVRAMSGGTNLPDGMALAVARAYLGRDA